MLKGSAGRNGNYQEFATSDAVRSRHYRLIIALPYLFTKRMVGRFETAFNSRYRRRPARLSDLSSGFAMNEPTSYRPALETRQLYVRATPASSFSDGEIVTHGGREDAVSLSASR